MHLDYYCYSFQGQEHDDEVKGKGNSINYKYRMHDPRIGRFFAVDPLAGKYPWYTPYQFSGNKVIYRVELEGLEEELPWYLGENKSGDSDKPVLTLGAGEIDRKARFQYSPTDAPVQTGLKFFGNGAVFVYNSLADTWNGGIQGKTYTQMKMDDITQTTDFVNRASAEDWKKLLTSVEFYEGLIGSIGTGYLFSKIPLSPKNFSFRNTPSADLPGTKSPTVETKVHYIRTNTGKQFRAESIRFSQSSVNRYGKAVESVENGTADPIDIVKMKDNMYTTVDNTRLLAAKRTGNKLEANVHSYDEPLPDSMLERFENPNAPGEYATTWGQAVEFRTNNQNAAFRANYGGTGTFVEPSINSH